MFKDFTCVAIDASCGNKSNNQRLRTLLITLIIIVAFVLITLIPSLDSNHYVLISTMPIYNVPDRYWSNKSDIGSVHAKPFRYATLLLSTFYAPAFEVFIYTFVRVANSYPLIVLIPSDFEGTELHSKIVFIMNKYENSSLEYEICFCPLVNSNPSKYEIKENKNQYSSSLRDSYIKFQLWTLVDLSLVFFVSVDSIFLYNTDDIFHMKNPAHDLLQRDITNTYFKNNEENCESISSVFLVRPSMETYYRLMSRAKAIRGFSRKGHLLRAMKPRSQIDLFSEIFSKEEFRWAEYLPESYYLSKHCTLNTSTKEWLQNLYTNHDNNVKKYFIFQFDGEAPWSSWSSTIFRSKFVPIDYVKQRQLKGRWDSDSFTDLHEMWKHLYLKAREKEYQSITIFQTYHSADCCLHLNRLHPSYRHVRLNGPLCEQFDIDAVRIIPELSDKALQITLGEFGAMLAVDRQLLKIDTTMNISSKTLILPSNPFEAFDMVGFTSWRSYQKADFKHGASLDWTKIDFQSSLHKKSIYFWYGYYSERDFYRTTESYHRGMTKVIQSCANFQLPVMGPGYYFYSNYFITRKDIFLRYMISAKAMVQCFLERYDNDQKCPFSVPKEGDDELSMNFRNVSGGSNKSGIGQEKTGNSRCLGYLLERYINIWATHSGTRSVFAVDHPAWRRRQRKSLFSSLL